MSRDKGARGEREVVTIARAKGFCDAHRTAPLQAGRTPGIGDVTLGPEFSQLHIEVKRSETLSVDAMVRQAVKDAASKESIPLVAWRRNGTSWRLDAPLDWVLELIRKGSE